MTSETWLRATLDEALQSGCQPLLGLGDRRSHVIDQPQQSRQHALPELIHESAVAIARSAGRSASWAAAAHVSAVMLSARALAVTSMTRACWLRPETRGQALVRLGRRAAAQASPHGPHRQRRLGGNQPQAAPAADQAGLVGTPDDEAIARGQHRQVEAIASLGKGSIQPRAAAIGCRTPRLTSHPAGLLRLVADPQQRMFSRPQRVGWANIERVGSVPLFMLQTERWSRQHA